jgi:hypothetical protein
MQPSTPKAIPSWIYQAQRGYQGILASKKGLWVSVQLNCLCTQTFCANNNNSSLFYFLVARASWSHLQCASTSSLSRANAWFHPISKVTNLSFLFFNDAPVYWSGPLPFSAGYSTYPSCQDNLLQHCRPNLCFGISISHLGSTDVQICHIRPNSHQFIL